MEPAHGRRLSRLAITLWVAPPALVAVWVWAEPDVGGLLLAFVAVTPSCSRSWPRSAAGDRRPPALPVGAGRLALRHRRPRHRHAPFRRVRRVHRPHPGDDRASSRSPASCRCRQASCSTGAAPFCSPGRRSRRPPPASCSPWSPSGASGARTGCRRSSWTLWLGRRRGRPGRGGHVAPAAGGLPAPARAARTLDPAHLVARACSSRSRSGGSRTPTSTSAASGPSPSPPSSRASCSPSSGAWSGRIQSGPGSSSSSTGSPPRRPSPPRSRRSRGTASPPGAASRGCRGGRATRPAGR